MARQLGVESKWLRAEAESGRLPHIKANKTILFDADTVERILLSRASQKDVKPMLLTGQL